MSTKNIYLGEPLLAPSLLSANFLQLQDDCAMLNNGAADWYHLDVMDGVFVPNISFGPMFIEFFRKATTKVCDVHLMIVEPEKYIETFANAGADIITVHYEACTHLHRTVQQIKATGAKAGVALNPHTPVNVLQYILPDIDLVCIMSVNPGFGGQSFIPTTIEKVKELKQMVEASKANTLIEIDGGVGLHNAESLIKAGADVLVAGNAVFKTENPTTTMEEFKKIMKK
jgi:ribulose-phosphate 3-epimerase